MRRGDGGAVRFTAGGRLYAFGNGGSSTDCATFAALFAAPPAAPGSELLPGLNLSADQAVVTALGNDVGFDLIFSRQIIAHAGSGISRWPSPPAGAPAT